MEFCIKVNSFVIKDETIEAAYISGCKKLAPLLASKKYKNTMLKVERTENEGELMFSLLASLELKEEQKNFCRMCKEFHCSFFVNEEYNCSRCNLKNFLKRMGQKAKVVRGFYLSRLR